MTLLNCLQTTFEQTLNWSSKIRKRNREKVINISQERSEELIVSFILIIAISSCYRYILVDNYRITQQWKTYEEKLHLYKKTVSIILSVLLRVLITPQINLMPHLDFQNNTAGYEILELSLPAA